MATIVKTESGSWKALVRKTGWPATSKNFRTKLRALDWARSTEEEMVHGLFIKRTASAKMSINEALKRYEKKSCQPKVRLLKRVSILGLSF